MPTCDHCNYQWTYGETLKKSFTLDTGMYCSNCGVKQYPTNSSKKLFSLLSFLPLCSMFLLFFHLSALIIIAILLSSSILVLLSYPVIVKLSEKEGIFP